MALGTLSLQMGCLLVAVPRSLLIFSLLYPRLASVVYNHICHGSRGDTNPTLSSPLADPPDEVRSAFLNDLIYLLLLKLRHQC